MAEKKKFKLGEAPWEQKLEKGKSSFKVGEAPWELDQKKPEVSAGEQAEAALQGFGQAATFGYLPQLQALAQPILEPIYETVTGENLSDVEKMSPEERKKNYLKERDEFLKRDVSLAQKAPLAYGAGTVAGALALPGGSAATGAGAAAKIAKAGMSGALFGALYNPGDKEGEFSGFQLEERIKQGLIGGATAGVLQGTMKAGEKAAQLWANKGKGLEKSANQMALKALGAKTGELRKLYNKRALDKVGKFALDEGVVGPGKTVVDSQKIVKKILDETGEEIGSLYQKVDDTLNSPEFFKGLNKNEAAKLFKTELNPKVLAENLLESVKTDWAGKAGSKQVINKAAEVLEDLSSLGNKTNVNDLLKFRRSVDDLINFDKAIRDTSGAQQALRKVRTEIQKKINDRIRAVSNIAKGKPGLSGVKQASQRLKELNAKFSTASDARDVLLRSVAREESKLPLGLYDVMAGGALGSLTYDQNDPAGSLARGLIGAAGVKAARTYGPGGASKLMQKASKGLMSIPGGGLGQKAQGLLQSVSPARTGLLSETFRRRTEEQ